MAIFNGTTGDDVYVGTGDADTINGNGGNDTLNGAGGDDIIDGGEGTDLVSGGDGNDELFGGDARTTGNWGDDILDGGAGDDTLHSHGFEEALIGGGGNDVYHGILGQSQNGWTVNIVELDGGGIDTIHAEGGFFTIPENVENLYFTGTQITGNILDNLIVYIDGHPQGSVNAGGGNDTIVATPPQLRSFDLFGEDGDDTYYVNFASIGVFEASGGGYDHVLSSVSYTLGADSEVERLSATLSTDTTAIDLTGNALGNLIEGNAGANILSGGAGNDNLHGFDGDDTLIGGADADSMNGGGGLDTLSYADSLQGVAVSLATGSASGGDADGDTFVDIENLAGSVLADTLTGDDGANTIAGRAGSDMLDGGDGIDTVSYAGSTLGVFVRLFNGNVFGGDANGDTIANFENVLGSSSNDDLRGSSAANVIEGGVGGDYLDGFGGIDTLSYAGSTLGVFVRLFNDSVFGGDANGDTIANFENVLGSSNNDDLRGSSAANVIEGGAGGDYLDGFGGIDTLSYAGSTLGVFVRLFSGSVFGGDANGDTIANFENVLGSSNNDDLFGSNGENVLDGGSGNDRLSGHLGNDMLIGGDGNDTFRFTTGLGASNVDTIADYSVADDVIEIDDTAFAGLAPGALAAGAFHAGAGATEADDRIIYNPVTGALLFDADGNGAGTAVQFAAVSAGLAMTADEFVVI